MTARERRQIAEQRELARAEQARIRGLVVRERALQERERAVAQRERAVARRERATAVTEAQLRYAADDFERQLAKWQKSQHVPAPAPRISKARKVEPVAPPKYRPEGKVYTERRLENLFEAMSDHWGIDSELAESLVFDLAVETHAETAEYIDDLYEQLELMGYDIDISDLWDMYYGYAPRSGR